MKEDIKFTQEMLKDGSELVYLKHRFQTKKTKEQLDWLFACIRDSLLIVPLIPISHKPDLMEDPDRRKYLPLFSQKEQLPPDYADEFDLAYMSFAECADLAHSQKDAEGMALDPFTETMIIEYDMADVILKMPSRLYK